MCNTVVFDASNKIKHNTAPGLGAVAAGPLAKNCCAQNTVHTIATESMNRTQIFRAMVLIGVLLLCQGQCLCYLGQTLGTIRNTSNTIRAFALVFVMQCWG